LDYKDPKYLQNPIKSTNYLCVLLVVFVVFCQKPEFAATLLPPKMCLTTGVIEDWWQGGSKIKKIFFRA